MKSLSTFASLRSLANAKHTIVKIKLSICKPQTSEQDRRGYFPSYSQEINRTWEYYGPLDISTMIQPQLEQAKFELCHKNSALHSPQRNSHVSLSPPVVRRSMNSLRKSWESAGCEQKFSEVTPRRRSQYLSSDRHIWAHNIQANLGLSTHACARASNSRFTCIH